MTLFEIGAVYRYNYLWARERDAGEESGRKCRPCCLLFRAEKSPYRLYLFPITSQQPPENRKSRAVSAVELRLGGLAPPSWILLDETNVVLAARPYDFVSTKPIGQFSQGFMKELATTARDLASGGFVQSVART